MARTLNNTSNLNESDGGAVRHDGHGQRGLHQSKKLKPFPPEVERAHTFPIENDEIGLLDIVLWDAIAKNEASHQ
jgi:hypothetical protein